MILIIAGCTNTSGPDGTDKGKAKIAENDVPGNLGQLSPEDRKLAEAQRYCANNDDQKLGSMGVPIKLTIKGEPVFICCAGCKKAVEKDPDATLKKVADLKKKSMDND